jgi:hypothetical protein
MIPDFGRCGCRKLTDDEGLEVGGIVESVL